MCFHVSRHHVGFVDALHVTRREGASYRKRKVGLPVEFVYWCPKMIISSFCHFVWKSKPFSVTFVYFITLIYSFLFIYFCCCCCCCRTEVHFVGPPWYPLFLFQMTLHMGFKVMVDAPLPAVFSAWHVKKLIQEYACRALVPNKTTAWNLFLKNFCGDNVTILWSHWYSVSDFDWLCSWVLKPGGMHHRLRLIVTYTEITLDRPGLEPQTSRMLSGRAIH